MVKYTGPVQGELNFGNFGKGGESPDTSSADGIALWRKQREEAQRALAKKMGLPLGQNVEVWLRGGIRLRGRLELAEETLFHLDRERESRFAIKSTPFAVSEMESCIRI